MTTPAFRVAVVGPSRVGKTTLLTAILSDTQDLLAGTPITVEMDERTRVRVKRQQKELQQALDLGEFNAAALGGTQEINRYHVTLTGEGDTVAEIPFDLLDYPGAWLDEEERVKYPHAVSEWPNFLDHVRESIMLLVPIDAAVLMEAVTPPQRAAVSALLGLIDVNEVGRRWAKGRQQNGDEPAVVVLAPLKCEKYFNDNGGRGHQAGELRARVRERYDALLRIVAQETAGRSMPVRVVYAPIDTYGCVELIEARWKTVAGRPDFEAHYRFRGRPPVLQVRAAGTVMQELCRSILVGQTKAEIAQRLVHQREYDAGVERKAAAKGFWETMAYHLTGEASRVNRQIRDQSASIARVAARQAQLLDATRRLAAVAADPRVEVWSGEDWR
jgi:hypothetical protein